MSRSVTVAIDGPAGAGKSTAARLLAGRLGLMYIDTGAMYRAVTLKFHRLGLDTADVEGLRRLLAETQIHLAYESGSLRVFLDGADVTAEIRQPSVDREVSRVSALPEVRDRLLALQRKVAEKGGVVLDGRDIGTRVLPWADYKFYLTATIEERARRRHAELRQKGSRISEEEVRAEMERRDRLDSTRAVDPLRPADDAIVIDTTGLGVDDVVDRMVQIIAAGE